MPRSVQSLRQRMAAFRVTEADLAALAGLRDFAAARLPALIRDQATELPDWPEVARVLRHPEVQAIRTAHWQRLVGGRIDTEFVASAHRLGKALHEHGLPIFGVSLCAVSVKHAVAEALGLTAPTGRGRAARGRLRESLSRAVWMHSELLLETYTEVASEAHRLSLRAMAERMEAESRQVVTGVDPQALAQLDHLLQRLSQGAAA